MSITLHKPTGVFSLRHAPSWMLLALGAGSVNAGAFLACERFVTHVTGTVTRIGLDIGLWYLVLEYALVLLCFIAGAMASVLAIDGRYYQGKRPLHALPLVAVSGVLVLVAVAGSAEVFGPFGASVEEPADFTLLSLLGFAMGLQNAAVATSTGLAVRTTHLTGPATDLGVHLGTLLYAQGEVRQAALRGALLRGGKIFSFVLGAVVMVPVARSSQYLAFLLPAALVLLATVLSFLPAWRRLPRHVPQLSQ
jgi:uncharacterized membrane protein YoaK (UPF0700 family)